MPVKEFEPDLQLHVLDSSNHSNLDPASELEKAGSCFNEGQSCRLFVNILKSSPHLFLLMVLVLSLALEGLGPRLGVDGFSFFRGGCCSRRTLMSETWSSTVAVNYLLGETILSHNADLKESLN